MPPGYLVYKFVLHYEPSPKRFPSRAHRVDVDIECRYPRLGMLVCFIQKVCEHLVLKASKSSALHRNHHVHQLAVQPTWETVVFRKRLKSRHTDYQITLMDGMGVCIKQQNRLWQILNSWVLVFHIQRVSHL